uniref:Uncharacterized protein n=1 Tax=Opuntia streptacantha TaxID=393608 RepID=A0A7C8YP38_OPUST
MKGAVANVRTKKSKVMKKSSNKKLKNSLTPSTQKRATRKPAKLTCSVTQQKLVINTNDSVMEVQAEMVEETMTVELDSKEPQTPPPSTGRGGSIHDATY